MAAWAPMDDFYILDSSRHHAQVRGKTVAIPVPAGEMLPSFPATGIHNLGEAAAPSSAHASSMDGNLARTRSLVALLS